MIQPCVQLCDYTSPSQAASTSPFFCISTPALGRPCLQQVQAVKQSSMGRAPNEARMLTAVLVNLAIQQWSHHLCWLLPAWL